MDEHPEAREIVETLARAGFVAYYAGGWVRDFLLGHPSDDIDIATNAPPETIQALFPRTVPLGIAFGIVLVLIGKRQYEIATFRQDFDYIDGRRPSRVEFTTAQEDAKRRDFTINGMFYDPLTGKVIDYVDGKADLERRLIRAIGDPHERIREDRLRMMRALRLSCRFGFAIEAKTEQAIRAHAQELMPAVAIERVVQELEKARGGGKLRELLVLLHEFGLLGSIFPVLREVALEEVKANLVQYPAATPLIGWLMALFSRQTADDIVALTQRLKLATLEQQFGIFLLQARARFTRNAEAWEWAHFYAHRFSELCLDIHAAHLDADSRRDFLIEHAKRKNALKRAIERIQTRRPLIASSDLAAAGIPASPAMGALLKEAERIAINEQIEEKAALLARLKNSPAWPHTGD